jgi:hypothetical protein
MLIFASSHLISGRPTEDQSSFTFGSTCLIGRSLLMMGQTTFMDLTDEQRSILRPLIPEQPRRPDGKGRPWRDCRDILKGILWILRIGACWHDMPDRYPPYQTCHRRFQQWIRSGVFERVLPNVYRSLICIRNDLLTDDNDQTLSNPLSVWRKYCFSALPFLLLVRLPFRSHWQDRGMS